MSKHKGRDSLGLFSLPVDDSQMHENVTHQAFTKETVKPEDTELPPVPDFNTVLNGGINRCVSWFLVHSYLYYRCDVSRITDSQFDALCKRLLTEFDTITHKHKKLLTKEGLRSGSGFYIPEEDYPMVVKNVAFRLQNNLRGVCDEIPR